MKLITVNINPSEHFRNNKDKIPDEQMRKNRIIDFVEDNGQYPDVIFFIEQWYPVFEVVQQELKKSYTFYFPKGFNPSFYKEGIYPSHAGVVAAVRSELSVKKAEDGENYVTKTAKWLSLEIDTKVYLAVHYPQPGGQWDKFHEAVKKYVESKKPVLIMGDFNTPKGCPVEIDGYADVLPPKEPTFVGGTKLDYIFVPQELSFEAKAENMKNSMKPDSNQFFSDHAVTKVNI